MTRTRKNISQKQAILEHGKLPPQAVDIEEIVLGSMMLENNCIHSIAAMITEDVFYREANQIVYRSIMRLYDNNEPVDILTVANKLKALGELELAGGAFYITQLTSRIASAANVEYHAGIILQKYLQREIIRVATEITMEAFDDGSDAFDLLNKFDNSISKVSEFTARGGSMTHISDAIKKSFESAARREIMAKEGKSSGVTSGLHDLDRITGGWQNSDLIILAARPGMGKTSVALKFAISAAKSQRPVCFYSLEMSDERLADNILLSQCGISKEKFKSGFLSRDDWKELEYTRSIVDKLPIYIDPNPSVSMRYIKAHSRVMSKKGLCHMVVIDYLQLADISSDDRTNRNREQDVAQASRQAKIIAKELNVPVILLSQLSRKVEDRHDKLPVLADLRESGAIEQDADLVLFVYRPEYYGIMESKTGENLSGLGKILIAKNRNGPTGDVKFRYNPEMTNIKNYSD